MRDSIALLDQLSVLNSAREAISVDDINNLLGRLSFDSLTSLFSAIAASNQNDALNILNDIYNQGNEPTQILSNLLEYLRNALILKTVGAEVSNTVVQLNEEQVKKLSECLKSVETHQIVSLIEKCADYIKELKLTTNPKLWLDVSVLDMANLTENTKLEDLQKRLVALESGEGVKMVNVSAYNTPPAPVKKPEVMRPTIKPAVVENAAAPATKVASALAPTEEEVLSEPVPLSKPAQTNNLKASWVNLLENVSSFPSRAILKQQALPVKISPDEVVISIKNPSWLKQFGQDGSKHNFIVDAVKSMYGNANKVIVRAPESGDDAIRKEASNGNSDDEAPAPAPAHVKENPVKKPKKEPEMTVQEVKEVVEIKQQTTLAKPKTGEAMFHSDTVNNVMDIFEGKFIE